MGEGITVGPSGVVPGIGVGAAEDCAGDKVGCPVAPEAGITVGPSEPSTGDPVGVTAPSVSGVVSGNGVGAAGDWTGVRLGTLLASDADVGEEITVGPSGVVPEPGLLPGEC